MSLVRYVFLISSCFILFACASAHIVIEVDLYDEDPKVTLPPTPKENSDLLAQAQVLPMEAKADRNLSQQWKQKVLNIYKNLWYSAGGSKSNETITAENLNQMMASAHPVTRLQAQVDFNQQSEEDEIASLDTSMEALRSAVDSYNRAYTTQLQKIRQQYATNCIVNSQEKSVSVDCFNIVPSIDNKNKSSNIPLLKYEKSPCFTRSIAKPMPAHDCEQELQTSDSSGRIPLTESEYIERKLSLGGIQNIENSDANTEDCRGVSLFECQYKIQQALTNVISSFDSYRQLPEVLVDWAPVESLIQAKLVQSIGNKMEQERLRKLVVSAQQQIQSLENQYSSDNQQNAAKAASSKEKLAQLQRGQVDVDFTGFQRTMPLAGSIREQLAEQARNTSDLYYLIDRLQDVGDPIWRTVTDPINEHHWNKKVSKSFVKAEGNTSMVIVRDTPLHFRAHQVKNDPTALIKGQLEVVRALGDAALSVAGVKLGATAQLEGDAPDKQSIGLTVNSADKNAEKSKKQVEQKQKALSAMTAQLRTLLSELEKLEKDDSSETEKEKEQKQKEYEAQLGSLRNKIVGLLQGYQMRFEVADEL